MTCSPRPAEDPTLRHKVFEKAPRMDRQQTSALGMHARKQQRGVSTAKPPDTAAIDIPSPVLPPEYSARLFRSSFTTCFSVFLAAHHELWYCAAMAFLVLITSINYWRHPVRGWRRTVDMTAVFIGMSYHIYCSSFCAHRTYQLFYLLFVAKTAYCYLQARRATCKDISSAWHCGVHVVGNVANVMLYTGLSM